MLGEFFQQALVNSLIFLSSRWIMQQILSRVSVTSSAWATAVLTIRGFCNLHDSRIMRWWKCKLSGFVTVVRMQIMHTHILLVCVIFTADIISVTPTCYKSSRRAVALWCVPQRPSAPRDLLAFFFGSKRTGFRHKLRSIARSAATFWAHAWWQ